MPIRKKHKTQWMSGWKRKITKMLNELSTFCYADKQLVWNKWDFNLPGIETETVKRVLCTYLKITTKKQKAFVCAVSKNIEDRTSARLSHTSLDHAFIRWRDPLCTAHSEPSNWIRDGGVGLCKSSVVLRIWKHLIHWL
jgi:hypothetical protein